MSMFWQAAGGGGGGPPPKSIQAVFGETRAAEQTGTNPTTYSVASVPIGVADATRKVYIYRIGLGLVSNVLNASSCTVNGLPATMLYNDPIFPNYAELWGISLAAGTSANIDITFANTKNYSTILVFTTYGCTTLAPSTIAASSPVTFTNTDTVTGTPAAGDVYLGMAMRYSTIATGDTSLNAGGGAISGGAIAPPLFVSHGNSRVTGAASRKIDAMCSGSGSTVAAGAGITATAVFVPGSTSSTSMATRLLSFN
jgi:hypothetical protein